MGSAKDSCFVDGHGQHSPSTAALWCSVPVRLIHKIIEDGRGRIELIQVDYIQQNIIFFFHFESVTWELKELLRSSLRGRRASCKPDLGSGIAAISRSPKNFASRMSSVVDNTFLTQPHLNLQWGSVQRFHFFNCLIVIITTDVTMVAVERKEVCLNQNANSLEPKSPKGKLDSSSKYKLALQETSPRWEAPTHGCQDIDEAWMSKWQISINRWVREAYSNKNDSLIDLDCMGET